MQLIGSPDFSGGHPGLPNPKSKAKAKAKGKAAAKASGVAPVEPTTAEELKAALGPMS